MDELVELNCASVVLEASCPTGQIQVEEQLHTAHLIDHSNGSFLEYADKSREVAHQLQALSRFTSVHPSELKTTVALKGVMLKERMTPCTIL